MVGGHFGLLLMSIYRPGCPFRRRLPAAERNVMELPVKRVKILATLGPASSSPQMIRSLIRSGVDVFRLNFSHGDHAVHGAAIDTIRHAAHSLKSEVAILADLQGPKIRTGRTLNDEPVRLETGDEVVITADKGLCTKKVITVDYKKIAEEVAPGQVIYINDGAIRLEVTGISDPGHLTATVRAGGSFSSRKGVNFPDVILSIPSLTAKDRRDLAFILTCDIQYVALSFVRTAADITALRKIVNASGKNIGIIAKIEKPEAARNVGEILTVADGIMVARGDLGVEATPFAVPVIQKELIQKANRTGKLVIVATQMLESMISSAIPTRAESTDVANAIIDGTDAVMLSGETAMGKYPVQAVETMVRIAEVTEKSSFIHREPVALADDVRDLPHAVCDAAVRAGRDLGNIPLCVFTISGATAVYLSKLHYEGSVIAFSPDVQVVRKLCLAWNILALHFPLIHNVVKMYSSSETLLLRRHLVRRHDTIGIISGTGSVRGATNLFRIKRVGEQ